VLPFLLYMPYVPPNAGTVLWTHAGATCTQLIHTTNPAYEIRVYAATGTTWITFFDDEESAARYADEQRVRLA
jgi:hypothetical protein